MFANRTGLVGKVAEADAAAQRADRASVPCASRSRSSSASRRSSCFNPAQLTISATAVSLQPGAIGDIISLRNNDSGTTIRGVMQADGTVRVGLP